VIIASNTSAALATKQSTTSTPIVVGSFIDPVGSGLVLSEARPGTNVTGMRSHLEGLCRSVFKPLIRAARTAGTTPIVRKASSSPGVNANKIQRAMPSNLLKMNEFKSAAAAPSSVNPQRRPRGSWPAQELF
jgi:ABC-type uncharacterized transport system substrate-binding protein